MCCENEPRTDRLLHIVDSSRLAVGLLNFLTDRYAEPFLYVVEVSKQHYELRTNDKHHKLCDTLIGLAEAFEKGWECR